MKFLLFITAFIFSFSQPCFAEQQNGRLTVNVGNVTDETGYFIVSIYKTETGFLKTPDQTFIYSVAALAQSSDSFRSITIDQLPFGSFALGVVHDVNGNKKTDTKIFGIPAEPVGFSNNPRNKFGPPKFKQSIFNFSRDQQSIQIDLIKI